MGCTSALGTVVAGAVVIKVAGDLFFPGVSHNLLFLGLSIVPVSLLFTQLTGVFQGLQDFGRYNFLTLVPSSLALIFVAVGLWILKGGVAAAVIAYMSGFLMGTLLALKMLAVYLRPTPHVSQHAFVRACLSYGIRAQLSNIITLLNYRIDVFLVNALLSPAAVGIYAVSVSVAERTWILSQAVCTVLFPLISGLKDEGKRTQVTPLISRWILGTGIASALLLGLTAKWLIRFLYGSAFYAAVEPLLWLLPGVVLWGFARVLTNDISARGKPEINIYLAIVSFVVNIGANLVLIPRFGIRGAAIASSISYPVVAIGAALAYHQLTGVPVVKLLVWWEEDFRLIKVLLRRMKDFKPRFST
jgi:O-antigen/teichoic acid export membrane protein